MPLSRTEVRQIVTAAKAIAFDAASEAFENFVGRILGWNPIEQAARFPQPDPAGELATAVAHVTREREIILRDECAVPSFAVFKNPAGAPQIGGFSNYLQTKGLPAPFLERIAQHAAVRTALRRLRQGHHLELLAAAIMDSHCDYGEATRGSGDQGIDAIGWNEPVLIEPSFIEGLPSTSRVFPGEKVFLFGSSKAVADPPRPRRLPKLINPAHIRELVGGWVIQRSSVGMWQKIGIRMLSPVQMILITTYRLSEDAKAECLELGIQVWGVPELIFLICHSAPVSVFDPASAGVFSPSAFRAWWRAREQTRRMAA